MRRSAGASHLRDNDSRGRLAFVIYFSFDSGAIAYRSIRETSVSHSAQESEISAFNYCIRHVMAFRELLRELCFEQKDPTKTFIDSKSSKETCDTLKVNDVNRHYNNELNYIRQEINRRNIELIFISSLLNVADLLTKNLSTELQHKFRDLIDIHWANKLK